MQIKGWGGLLEQTSFAKLINRKETRLDPLTETSEISFADANYKYSKMLNYTLSFPEGPRNRFSSDNSCISAISFLMLKPDSGLSTDMLLTFLTFMEENHMPQQIMNDIRLSYQESMDYALIGRGLGSEVEAGLVEHFRGELFVVNVNSLEPFITPMHGGSTI